MPKTPKYADPLANPRYTLSADEAQSKNATASSEKRLSAAAHELAHHMYAEHLDLESRGIELGHKAGANDSFYGQTFIGDPLKEHLAAGKLTVEEVEKHVRATLANGFGEEAVLGTKVNNWHNHDDLRKANVYMNAQGWSDARKQAFLNDNYQRAHEFFSESDNRAKLIRAAKSLSNHWGKGTVDAETVNRYLKGDK